MITRRSLVKAIPALGVSALVPSIPATAASLQPVPGPETRFIGTPVSGGIVRLGTGIDLDELVLRSIGIDQDIDGSWIVWADPVTPCDDDEFGPGGSIRIYDPAVASFLEQFYALLADPIAFEHLTIGSRPSPNLPSNYLTKHNIGR